MAIGTEIMKIRKQKKISQKEFAVMINKTPSYLSLIETNQKIPSMELLKNIGEKLGVPLYYLLFKSINVETEIPEHKKDTYRHLSPLLDSIISQIFLDGESEKSIQD